MGSGVATTDRVSNFLRSALETGVFVCTAELVLGRDHNTVEAEEFVRDASGEPDGIKVISLSDLPGGHPALPPEAFVPYVHAHRLTPIVHLTGKDGNRSLLEGRLHALARLGTENILALTGDAQKQAFAGESKPVHDLDSVLILWLLGHLRHGLDYNVGTKTERTTSFDFFSGAVVNPYKIREPDLLMQLYKLRLKVAAGAQFIIPQIGYNLRKLYELKQYMARVGIGHVPVLANIYVPTATVARRMQSGEIAGCVITEPFIKRLETEKKPQRLERAALMVAAVKDLGFAGAHIGGFGLCHRDFMAILERASAIGKDWRARMDELVYPQSGEFYLLPPDSNGFSDGAGQYQTAARPHASLVQRLCEFAYGHLIRDDAPAARFFGERLKSKIQPNCGTALGHSVWCMLLAPSNWFRKAALGCVSCGDCLQDHLSYAGCSMHGCYKELRNGPCGGSRVDGSCEARPEVPCIWNLVYSAARATGDDPEKFAHILIPPRDWHLNRTNALVNRLAGLDNFHNRSDLVKTVSQDT